MLGVHMVSVLIISTNETQSIHVLRCLSILRTRIHIMGVSRFHPIRLSKYCDNYIKVEKQNLLIGKEDTINDINNYCRQYKIDIVIPVGIDATLFISKIRDKIEGTHVFPLTDVQTLKILNNKWTFTELLIKNDLPCPKTILISDFSQIETIDFEFPVIAKALDLEGGKGVAKLDSFEELRIYLLNGNGFNKLPLLIQEYIPGIDVDFSVLAKNGNTVAWTIQKWSEGKDIIQFIKDDNVLGIGKQIVSICNYSGVAHIDMRFDERDGSIKIIECNPRFWSSVEISMLSGINFPYLGIVFSQNEKHIGHFNYKEIKYLKPKRLIVETLKNISLKDFNRQNLYFLREIILDPLFYINIQYFYFFLGLRDKLCQWRNRI